MNAREENVADRYTNQGWKVLRGGAPDFLMLKVANGEIGDVRAVEVKSFKDELTYEQAPYRMVLERAGFQYIVELVD